MKVIITTILAIGFFSSLSAFEPNDPYFNFEYDSEHPENIGQWYLHNTLPENIRGIHNAGLDINVMPVWKKGVTGKKVVIAIVDNGVQPDHPDLAPNYRADLSLSLHEYPLIQQHPQGTFLPHENHGTAVAGIIAAKGGNGIGITGIAPDAQISGIQIFYPYDPTHGTPTCFLNDKATIENAVLENELFLSSDLESVLRENNYIQRFGISKTNEQYKYVGEPQIDVVNYSLSLNPVKDESSNSFFPVFNTSFQATSKNNVIQVLAAGNDALALSDESVFSSIGIVVSGIAINGKRTSYSNYGSAVFVTAPTNEPGTTIDILTTDHTQLFRGDNSKVCLPIQYTEKTYVCDIGNVHSTFCNPIDFLRENESIDDDIAPYSEENIDHFHDSHYTSTFSGTSAAAPMVSGVMTLGKQVNPLMDVRLAKHALVQSSRRIDANDTSWIPNAAQNAFSRAYGFGLIDASAFIEKTESIAYVTSPQEVNIKMPQHISIVYRKDCFSIPFILVNDPHHTNPVEDIQIHLTFSGALLKHHGNIFIQSPQGTISPLIREREDLYKTQVNLVTNAFWGEPAQGKWKLIFKTLNTDEITKEIQNIPQNDYNLIYNPDYMGLMASLIRAVEQKKIIDTEIEPLILEKFEVHARFGQVVNESPSMVIEKQLQAESIVLKKPDTHLHIQPEAHVTLKDGILLNQGTITLDGTVDQTDFKGNRITLNGGLLTGSGVIYAKRSVENNDGKFVPNGLTILGSYSQGPRGTMTLHLNDEGKTLLTVTDNMLLDGGLKIVTKNRIQKLKTGDIIDFIEASNIIGRFERISTDIQDENYAYHIHRTKGKLALTVIQDSEQCINPDLLDSQKSNNFLDTLNPKFGSPSYKPVFVNKKEITVNGHVFKIHLQNPARSYSPPFPHGLQWKDPACIGFADDDTEVIILDENNNTLATAPINNNQTIKVGGGLYDELYEFILETHLDTAKDSFYITITCAH